MGLAKNTSTHKQDNFFLFFPVYVCLGVYYVLHFIATPIIWLWNSTSNSLYKGVNKVTKENEVLRGAVMTGVETAATATNAMAASASTFASVATNATTGLNVNNSAPTPPSMNNAPSHPGFNTNNNPANTGATTAASMANTKPGAITNAPMKKEVKISQKLLQEREALINSIDANEEVRNTEPVIYKYTALNPEGKQVTNTFTAFSKVEVYTFLENEGYKVFKIETSPMIQKMYGSNPFTSRKVKNKDIVFWLQQLSTYIKAGIPLTDAMRILSKQMGKNDNLKRTFDAVVYNLTLGESFSTALEKQGDSFPPLLINMIRSAEATGDLEGTLDDMADYYQSTETTRKEMKSALTYPIMILIFAVGIVIFILIYLIPQFVGIYETAGVQLNPITAFIIAASDFLQANLLYIIVVVAAIIGVIVVLYKNVKAFKYYMQTMMMKIPVFGNMIIYKEMMIFTKTFSSLLKNNVFITESMDILGKVTNNEIYREIMINTVNYIGRGEKISSAFKDHWAIPDVAYYMMVTGESTGELAEMMGKVSEYYAEQHKTMIDSMKSLIEPILIIFLAVVVGGIMIAVIVPMFGLYSEIM